MKKTLILLTALILFIPSIVFSDIVSFKVGYFIPKANSDLWEIEFENMDFTKSNFQNTNFGFGYEYFLSREISIVLNISSYNKNKPGAYLDYVGENIESYDYAFDYGEGYAITHTFSVSITPIQASLKLTPLGRKAKIIPYVGGGVGVYMWNIRLYGDMIDFDSGEWFYDPGLNEDVIGYPIYYADTREENRISIGYHGFGGIMIPVANRISLEAEFRYNFLKGTMGKDPDWGFQGFEPFDLSGYQISIGMNYWF